MDCRKKRFKITTNIRCTHEGFELKVQVPLPYGRGDKFFDSVAENDKWPRAQSVRPSVHCPTSYATLFPHTRGTITRHPIHSGPERKLRLCTSSPCPSVSTYLYAVHQFPPPHRDSKDRFLPASSSETALHAVSEATSFSCRRLAFFFSSFVSQ